MSKILSPENDAACQERRKQIANTLRNHKEKMDFTTFLSKIDQKENYSEYSSALPNLFTDIAQNAPLLTENKMSTKPGNNTSSQYLCVNEQETCGLPLMTYFFELHQKLADAATGMRSAIVPKCFYKLTNHQNTPMSQDNYKANGVLLYQRTTHNISAVHMPIEINVEVVDECIPENAFENIVDYVYAIWNSQPTRTFVPTLYLNETQLTLLVFTQDKWYEVIIGPLCYSTTLDSDSDFQNILIAMQKYWFIVTLSSQSFGHFCDVNNELQYLDLIHDFNDWIMTNARILNTTVNNTSAIEINKRIPHQIYARNRAAYLFDTNHSVYGRVVLKLSWTPVDRLPESAVYDLLASTDVENIPKIYDCGLLKDNFFGHRLEYMVIEHCGMPIDKHFEEIRKQEDSSTKAKEEIEWILPQVASCLIQAVGHGILHRDISLGNIAISKGQVKVIDWGYAKILSTTDLDIDTIATRWHFDKQNVLANETEHDPLTGTWLYMSIQVLFESQKRDIMDDLESLFYVFLDALWRLYSSPSDNYTSQDSRLGFQFHNKKTLAATRAGILGSKDTYPQFFGFDLCCQSIPEVLNSLYECLFYSDNRYIAPVLVHDPYYKRTISKRLASKFLNAAAIKILEKHQELSNGESVNLPDGSNVQARVFYDSAIEDKFANYAAVNDNNDTLLTPPSLQKVMTY